jgi:hypothetical protein
MHVHDIQGGRGGERPWWSMWTAEVGIGEKERRRDEDLQLRER